MTPHYIDDCVTVYAGDSLEILATLPDESVDAVVCDPPYGLEFMGRDWDSFKPANAQIRTRTDQRTNPTNGKSTTTTPEAYIAGIPYQQWCQAWAAECLRVLKPGGHLLAFGGTRTWHRLTCAIEDAGFEVRDCIMWVYGSGFPKSLDVSKAIDKAAGADREVVGAHPSPAGNKPGGASLMMSVTGMPQFADITAPATDDAKRWAGWGTALKPSHEPVVVARKPFAGTVAGNVVRYGTGALNIDGCRIGTTRDVPASHSRTAPTIGVVGIGARRLESELDPNMGRWPTNVVLSHVPLLDGDGQVVGDACAGGCVDGCPVAELDRQSGQSLSVGGSRGGKRDLAYAFAAQPEFTPGYGDTGGASRFFPVFRYEAKADSQERPHYYRPSCDCEEPCPTTSRARATAETTTAADSSTSRSGNDTTADPSPTGTTSTTSTTTNSTTTPPTSFSSRNSSTSESTPDVSSAAANGGNPAASAASSNPSTSSTGTSAPRAGRSTDDADRATSPRWSATSVCGNCGAPARREAHATVKPVDLMRWLVRLVTPPGGLVLDPFLGSGTTAEACVVEGMRCVGVEREASYLPLIVDRVSKPLQPVLDLGV